MECVDENSPWFLTYATYFNTNRITLDLQRWLSLSENTQTAEAANDVHTTMLSVVRLATALNAVSRSPRTQSVLNVAIIRDEPS